jgi:transposase
MENAISGAERQEKNIEELKKEVAELKALVRYYEEQICLARQKRFGQSSEKADPRQMGLFDEPDRHEPVQATERIAYTRRKRRGKREGDLSGIPTETVTHMLPEGERTCPECGGPLHVMGHSEPRREIEIIPARVKVVEHVQEVYSCRACERGGISVPVIKAPMPVPVIKGGFASPSSVAHIMAQKYVNAMPLYRQEHEFAMNGFMLSRQTMANWMAYCSERWLEPLYECLKAAMLRDEVLHADETALQVLDEPGRKPGATSYMWLYKTGRASPNPAAIYEYQETRASSHPKKFLSGFSGYLHADGYPGYHALQPGITVVGCWAHARRKFDEAVKSAPPGARGGLPGQKGLDFCNRLFALEREFKSLLPGERHKKRIEQSEPLVSDFYAWANSAVALPKSALGRALRYALEQRPYLENVFRDGRLELSNNLAERSIKPFVIGRKNWMFSVTPRGARASSVIYSVVETAKENRLKPFEYLKYIFETMPGLPSGDLGSLLPWSASLPDRCKIAQT